MDTPLFGAIYGAAGSSADALMAVAREFSPRVQSGADGREVVIDLGGLTRLFGDRHAIAAELRRTAADRGLRIRVAIADGRTAARVLVQHRPGMTVIAPGEDAEALGALPVESLTAVRAEGSSPEEEPAPLVRTLRRWGVRTLAAFAALPAADVAARLGQAGVRWQHVARGNDLEPLVPAAPDERFEQAIDLEWPIEGLEPLSFVLGRLLEPLSAQLERRDRGAAVLHVRLHLVTRAKHERSLPLPVPLRDARTLRMLLLLDLESHPPPAAIDRVVVAVDPTPGRIVQFSLLTRPLPTPEQLSTLMARLQALMGETRCGAPVAVDSWQPGAFTMKPFAPKDVTPRTLGPSDPRTLCLALRRFRMPVVARVQVEDGRPVRVLIDRRGMSGGRVNTCAGPWRTSGGWWTDRLNVMSPRPDATASWDRDDWDVTLSDRVTYRLFRERDSEKWFVEGIVD